MAGPPSLLMEFSRRLGKDTGLGKSGRGRASAAPPQPPSPPALGLRPSIAMAVCLTCTSISIYISICIFIPCISISTCIPISIYTFIPYTAIPCASYSCGHRWRIRAFSQPPVPADVVSLRDVNMMSTTAIHQ